MKLNVEDLPIVINNFNYFEKNGEHCKLYSFGKNILSITDLNIDIKKNFCVSNETLNILKVLSPAEIEVTDSLFIIKSSKGEYKSTLLDSKYSGIDNNFYNKISVNKNILKTAIMFTSKVNNRPILTGVNINKDGYIYSTDSYTIFRYNCYKTNKDDITIPNNFCDLISKFDGDEVEIYYNEDYCMAKNNKSCYISSLFKQQYPNCADIYQKFVGDNKLYFNKTDLLEKINIASTICKEDNVITFDKNILMAKSELNQYKVELKNKNDFYYHFSIINSRLLNVLNNLESEDIKIDFNESLKPFRIIENNAEYILLPVKEN